jgi:hypothetical protein
MVVTTTLIRTKYPPKGHRVTLFDDFWEEEQ